MVRKITVDEEVYAELGRRSRPFEQPNDTLRRVLFGEKAPAPRPEDAPGALRPLLEAGGVHAGDELVCHRRRKGETYSARVGPNGAIVMENGDVFDSPSRALSEQTGTSMNGWMLWVHSPSGSTLAQLRDELP